MSPLLFLGPRSFVVRGWIWVLAALPLLFAGTAWGQDREGAPLPNTKGGSGAGVNPPQVNPPQVFPPQVIERVRDNTEKKGEPAQATPTKVPAADTQRPISEFFDSPLVWVAILVVVLPVVCWVVIRLRATTNPLTLAARDPWVRARLAERKAERHAKKAAEQAEQAEPQTDDPGSHATPPPLPRKPRETK